ncbi:MAG: DUF4926 domain-containing protein [Acidobacteriaceae bacterium]|nr:DUF4926 domain-containing protein [Acidobacteriaceae bacterium]MBV9780973.1 DUF4926 domain-containing protein [Acidobacteriaceae bacterium]
MQLIKPFAVVALMEDLPSQKLQRGQVGTVLEELAPGVYEIEFSDMVGKTYATVALRTDQVMKLHYERSVEAA